MLTLAIDTSEVRGSVALERGELGLATRVHPANVEYSGWLLSAVSDVLVEARVSWADLELLAVSTGPGSFTGLRVGLTAVKAWAEVYKKPVVGVSRLQALALSGRSNSGLVAATYDAQRGQLFGGLFGRMPSVLEECVIAPEAFVSLVDAKAGSERITWRTLDPEQIQGIPLFEARLLRGDRLETCLANLAPAIAKLAQARAALGEWSDPVSLDANYVRRSDAEIFWKGSSAGAR